MIDHAIPVTIDYLEEDGVYRVSCPWLQGCHAWGTTLDEAMRAIPGNIRVMVEARQLNGSPIPDAFTRIDLTLSFTLRMVPA